MDNISASARKAFDQAITRALRRNLCRASEDQCSVAPLPQGAAAPAGSTSVLVLTLSSFRFRLVLLFHLPEDAAARAYFVRDGGMLSVARPCDPVASAADAASEGPALVFEEVFAEIGNMCCGSINRDLSSCFRHLGMSTPYTLSNHSLDGLDALAPELVSRYLVSINDELRLLVTVCICAYAPVDFSVDWEAADVEGGELELF